MAGSVTGFDEHLGTLASIATRQVNIRPIADKIHESFLDDFRSGKIPRDTGRLEESLTNPGSKDHIWKVRVDQVEFGSKDPASIFEGRKGTLPTVDADKVVQILSDYIIHGKI